MLVKHFNQCLYPPTAPSLRLMQLAPGKKPATRPDLVPIPMLGFPYVRDSSVSCTVGPCTTLCLGEFVLPTWEFALRPALAGIPNEQT